MTGNDAFPAHVFRIRREQKRKELWVSGIPRTERSAPAFRRARVVPLAVPVERAHAKPGVGGEERAIAGLRRSGAQRLVVTRFPETGPATPTATASTAVSPASRTNRASTGTSPVWCH
jgi:hypothetical protein